MKYFTGILLASAMAATPALAADVEPMAGFSWTGLYIGAHAGYAWGDGELADSYCDGVTAGHCEDNDILSPNFGDPGTWVSSVEMNDFVGGGHVGFNQQFSGNFVLGAEIDLDFGGDADAGFIYGGNFGYTDPDNDATGTVDLGLTGSARIRVGFAMDRWLPFVTAGVAYADYEATYAEPDNNNAPRSGDGSLLGWTVGAGLNYAMTDNVILGAEYRYVDYGSDTLNLANPALDADLWPNEVELQTHDVRVSASFKF